jgi:hypothetical protein
LGANYGLTEKAQGRLHFFDVFGCADASCPLCQGKKGYLTCPSCGHQMLKQGAKILKERDFFVVVRHTGVYYHQCLKLIFNEAQARLQGVRAEE